MPEGKASSRKKELKEKRRRQQQRQRLIALLIVGAIVLVIAIILIGPSITNATTPVGTVSMVTPYPRPNAKGTAAGDPNAPVKVDIYVDFQCPACRAFTEGTERQFIDAYVATGKVYYVFHQYPFIDDNSTTKESHQAANASECAADQDRFWDYHDILFANWSGENEGAFTDKRLVAFAQALNLDMNAFNTCFKVNTFKDKINQDLASGKQLGVTGTPSVFVNGKEVKPGYIPSFTDMQQAIDAALAGK